MFSAGPCGQVGERGGVAPTGRCQPCGGQSQTANHRLAPPFHRLAPPFTALSPLFRRLSPSFHRVQPPFTAFHRRSPPFLRLSSIFNRLAPPFLDLSPPSGLPAQAKNRGQEPRNYNPVRPYTHSPSPLLLAASNHRMIQPNGDLHPVRPSSRPTPPPRRIQPSHGRIQPSHDRPDISTLCAPAAAAATSNHRTAGEHWTVGALAGCSGPSPTVHAAIMDCPQA